MQGAGITHLSRIIHSAQKLWRRRRAPVRPPAPPPAPQLALDAPGAALSSATFCATVLPSRILATYRSSVREILCSSVAPGSATVLAPGRRGARRTSTSAGAACSSPEGFCLRLARDQRVCVCGSSVNKTWLRHAAGACEGGESLGMPKYHAARLT